ncbi:GpE family phage tail protein [Rhodocyclus gracilis]|uniref:GpE family phage tail protein n=1 Tax=Rhodocyclus tenuis TaxID=1066 RepID=A0A6L5JSK3_RHOTE|nr:GpE family phage tail protein [Rhodocyclus gracilis]MQY50179.1 GpE family phage tail protein [Rhodocyclus gracilis]
MGDIAVTFHFQPSELWEMSVDEFTFWHAQAVRVNRRDEG